MFAAPEVVAFLFAGMAGKTRLGNLFGRFILERDDLRRVTFFHVGLAWSMTRFAASHFPFPTAETGETRVRSVREGFELILVAGLTSFTADVITVGRSGKRETGDRHVASKRSGPRGTISGPHGTIRGPRRTIGARSISRGKAPDRRHRGSAKKK